MGEMRRATAREEEQRKRDRFASTLVISASIIAAVRLAREDISRPSPRLTSAVADSISLARMILDRAMR
jgi:GTP-sensing pleiotropic transcriptional regulator CodY